VESEEPVVEKIEKVERKVESRMLTGLGRFLFILAYGIFTIMMGVIWTPFLVTFALINHICVSSAFFS